jgi:hypothetical protein
VYYVVENQESVFEFEEADEVGPDKSKVGGAAVVIDSQ